MNRILSYFKHEGYESSALIGERDLQNLLGSISTNRDETPEQTIWKNEIFRQVWEDSAPDSHGRVVVSHYVRQVFKTHHNLNEQIHRKKEEIQKMQNQLSCAMRGIIDAADAISGHNDAALAKLHREKAENLNYLIKEYEEELEKLRFQQYILLDELQRSILAREALHGQTLDQSYSHEGSISDKTVQHVRKVYDKRLRILFVLSCTYILLQMFIMLCKYSFLDLLIGFLLLSIFLFSCFNHSYVKILLMLIVCSFIFDFVWLLMKTKQYWHVEHLSVQSALQIKLQRTLIFMIIIQIGIKGAIGYYLWPWRRLETEDIYYVKTMGSCDFTLTRSQARIKLQQKLIDDVFCGVIY